MIKANDLRIGNYIYRKNKLTNKENIIKLTASDILDISANREFSRFVYEPVPLTEEILLKCGFGIRSDGKLYNDSLSLYEVDFFLNSKSDRITNLHQLQNLYYALTNEELQINL